MILSFLNHCGILQVKKVMGWSKDPSPSTAGQTLAFFIMKELSIFVDESGDFGEYDYHSPYYILSFVFHDQDLDLTSALDILNQKLYSLGLGTAAIHTGPVIRQEEIYNAIDLDTRRKIMRVLLTF